MVEILRKYLSVPVGEYFDRKLEEFSGPIPSYCGVYDPLYWDTWTPCKFIVFEEMDPS